MTCATALIAVGLVPSASGGPAAHAGPNVAPRQAPQGDWVTDYIIVRVKPGVTAVRDAQRRWSFALTDEATRNMPARAAQDMKREAAKSQTLVRAALTNARATDVRPMGAWQDAERARRHRLDRYVKVMLPPGTTPAEAMALVNKLNAESALIEHAELDSFGTVAGEVVPNDPDFDLQYALENTFSLGADISATEAWAITQGAPQVVMAVLDSGVNNHADLSGRLVPGFNTVDDSTNTPDGCNHGTHVSGSAGANTNNGLGISGVNWHIRIMPIRVLTGCSGTEADLAEGLAWAADHGAHVANMSLQYSVGTQFLHDNVNYAREAGLVLIAAAGNFGTSGGVAFPARWSETIAVAATDATDQHWIGSNSGPEVTVAAPGVDIWSLSSTGGYIYNSGTSMATPHVSGLACLMITVDPTLTHEEIQQILIDTADDVESPGFDNLTGWGRINAHAALQAVLARLGVPGDVNADEVVNEGDRSAIQALFGVQWGDAGFNARADLNHDGFIDVADVESWDGIANFCPADLVSNETFQPPPDGVVDAADLAYVLGAWGANPDSPADMVSNATFQPPADGVVDAADLAYLLGWWGGCP